MVVRPRADLSDSLSSVSSSSSSSSSDRSVNNVTEVFPPPWKFVQTSRSGPDGVLVTHSSFVFHKDSNNRKGDINSEKGIRTFHKCSQKKIGCTATAVTLAKMVKNDAGKQCFPCYVLMYKILLLCINVYDPVFGIFDFRRTGDCLLYTSPSPRD